MSTPFEQALADLRADQRGDDTVPHVTIAGEDFTLYGDVGALEISELARVADLDSRSAEGAAALADFFRAAFGDHVQAGRAEYTRFRRHMRGRGEDALVECIADLVEAFAGFPTAPSSASQPGPSTSTPGSRDAGSQQDAPASQQTVPGLVLDEPGPTMTETSQPTTQEQPTTAPPTRGTVVNIGRRVS